jgi:hypothetical protein
MAQLEPLKGALGGQPRIGIPAAPLDTVVPAFPPAPVEEDELAAPVAIMPVVTAPEPAAFPVPSLLSAPPHAMALASVATDIKKGGRSRRFLRAKRCDMICPSS